jgi:hypothetical protein
MEAVFCMEQNVLAWRLVVKVDDAVERFGNFLSTRLFRMAYQLGSVPGGRTFDIDSPHNGPLGRVELRGDEGTTLVMLHPPEIPANAVLELDEFADWFRKTRDPEPLKESQTRWGTWRDGQFQMLIGLVRGWIESCQASGALEQPKTPKRGPTVKVQTRAEVFRRLKDAHPQWSYDKVAGESQEELGENIGGEAVRNAYRCMGWTWERANRIR